MLNLAFSCIVKRFQGRLKASPAMMTSAVRQEKEEMSSFMR